MAEPVKHNTTSSLSTAGWETAKGAGKGLLAVTLGGALLGGLIVGVPVAIFGTGAAALTAGGIAAAITGVLSLITGGSFGAAIGGLFGLAKGGDKISAENQKFRERAAHKQFNRETQINSAGIAGMQQGYEMGFAEGQAYVVNQLRALQEQQLMAQAVAAKDGHAAKVLKQREAQAVATPQLGA